jgi:hypothetical protein
VPSSPTCLDARIKGCQSSIRVNSAVKKTGQGVGRAELDCHRLSSQRTVAVERGPRSAWLGQLGREITCWGSRGAVSMLGAVRVARWSTAWSPNTEENWLAYACSPGPGTKPRPCDKPVALGCSLGPCWHKAGPPARRHAQHSSQPRWLASRQQGGRPTAGLSGATFHVHSLEAANPSLLSDQNFSECEQQSSCS